jgi:hypothetical protein
MLSTKEQRQLEDLLKKQAATEKPITESDLDEIEQSILAVYDRSPQLFGDGMSAWRNFCSNLDVLAGHNDRLVREIRRLNSDLSKYKKAIDGIYNHSESAREAVVEHFGAIHAQAGETEAKSTDKNPSY